MDLYNASFAFSLSILTVTDAGFPKEVPFPKGANLLFGTIFAENCMKNMKKSDWDGAHTSYPLDPPLTYYFSFYGVCYFLRWKKGKFGSVQLVITLTYPWGCLCEHYSLFTSRSSKLKLFGVEQAFFTDTSSDGSRISSRVVCLPS